MANTEKSLKTLIELTEKLNERDAQLEASEKRFRGFFNNPAAGMCIFNINTERFLEVNETLCLWLGYSRDEMLKHPISYFLATEDNAKTTDYLEGQRAKLNAGIGADVVYNFINVYKHKKGHDVVLLWRSSAPDEEGISYSICENITR